jgi:hypothetical protein
LPKLEEKCSTLLKKLSNNKENENENETTQFLKYHFKMSKLSMKENFELLKSKSKNKSEKASEEIKENYQHLLLRDEENIDGNKAFSHLYLNM